MRTEYLNLFLRETSLINRDVTHALFINEQFFNDYENLIEQNSDEVTSDLFSGNKYKDQFNYKLGKLEGVRKNYQNFLFQTSYIFIYSAYELYTENLFELIKSIKESNCTNSEDSWLRSAFNCIDTTLDDSLQKEERFTLDYFRLRRNQFLHSDGTPSRKLKRIIESKGTSLNKYWEKELDIDSFDFSSLETENFELDELIDFIRIIRKFAENIDKLFLKNCSKDEIKRFLITEFQNEYNNLIKNRTRERLISKFLNYSKHRFNLSKDDYNITSLPFEGV